MTASDTPPQRAGSSAAPESTTATGTGDLSGITDMFGLDRGPTGVGSTGSGGTSQTATDTVGRWVAGMHEGVAQPADVSGRLVHGRYRLIAELASGGMGVTYRAWDTQSHVPVVVKMPKREVRHDNDVMQRFAREIAAMQAVPHEAIVPITDAGSDEGCPFVVMRFLPGGSLADYRRWDDAGRPIKNPPGMLFFWLPGVAAALDRIHARRLLHRDVKPGNIFLDGFLKPFLGDFGIAKVVDESGGLAKEQTLTATKMAVGTPEYMAPELFKPRADVDGRVDQYALAVTVYEMLCGEKPFKGDRAHIIVEHSSLPVPPLERRCPGLPRSLYAAIDRALAKNPGERFATCGEFVEAALEDLKPLSPEADTVRLLCPSCRNILKLKSDAAGKSGKCPRCQAAIDVARDLGSLWLESEERGGGPVAAAVAIIDTAAGDKAVRQPVADETSADSVAAQRRARFAHATLLVATAIGGLIAGGFWGRAGADRERMSRQRAAEQSWASERERASQHHADEVRQLRQEIDTLNERLAVAFRFQTERNSLAAENGRLLQSLANFKARQGKAGDAQPKTQAPSGTPPVTTSPVRDAGIDDVVIECVAIPAGTFTMGSPKKEPGHSSWERQVDVRITEAFEIGKYEVTQRQWERVMKTAPWKGYGQSTEGPDHPATCVGWDGAMQFCQRLTDAEHARGTLPRDKVYRLPTEAEWEYACRAGSTTAFSFGDDAHLFDRYGWADGKPPRAVGLKQPNDWGVFDMHGNVSEWCLDWNDMKPLAGGDDPLGPEPGSQHMQRGGHSRYQAGWMHRSGYRKDGGTSGSHTEGFRVVKGSPRPITPPAPAIKEAVRLPPPKPLEAGETFTLSDEALLKLDFQPRSGQTARITKRLDVPGPGVEFDIEFKGNVDKDCGGEWVYRASNATPSEPAALSTDLTPYRAFGLQFELLGVDGKRPASFKAPLLVGSKLAGYSPESIDTSDKSRAVSVNSFHESWNPLRALGFVVNIPGWWYEKDPSKNPWPKQGCVVHLRVSPAPGAVPLPMR